MSTLSNDERKSILRFWKINSRSKSLISKVFFFSVIIVIGLVLLSLSVTYSGKSDYLNIPADQFQINTEIVYSHLPIEVQIRIFKCEYETAHGRDVFVIKPLNRDGKFFFKKIQYSNRMNNTLIYLRYSETNEVKACYISWENGSDPERPIDGQFYDVEIGKFTKWIKTNLSEKEIRKMYPDSNCPVIKKAYSKIEIDFNKDLQNLDFFKNIKFVE